MTEAHARAEGEESGPDLWTDSLEPSAAVRARAVPVLQRERDRLIAQLERVRESYLRHTPC